MRIIIEMNDIESRLTSIRHETAAELPMTDPDAAPRAIDGGPPADALLIALGAEAEHPANGRAGSADEADAGEPPGWLVDAVAAGRSPRFG